MIEADLSGQSGRGQMAIRVVVIGGFLGSGKTTLLLRLARRMADRSQRVVVIENEVGEIGIDDRYLALEGLQVQEIYNGCICCTLQRDLAQCLASVATVIRPDCLLLEPSGIADTRQVLTVVRRAMAKPENLACVVVVDAARLPMLASVMTPLISAQLESADIVAINKTDEVNEECLAHVGRQVAQLAPQARAIAVSAEHGTNLEQLLSALD